MTWLKLAEDHANSVLLWAFCYQGLQIFMQQQYPTQQVRYSEMYHRGHKAGGDRGARAGGRRELKW